MIKKIVIGIIIILIASLGFYGIYKNKDNGSGIDTVKVAEVTHSVFYTPWYIAIEKGFFKDQNIEIDMILTPGADKTAASVLSNDVHIGFSGIEATIYVYNNGEEDYLTTFAGLTKRDGQFIVGPCDEKDNFKVENLIGKSVLAGRIGGMPLMVFNYGLKESGINISEVKIDSSVEFAALSGAFISGQAQYVNLFEPLASSIESNNQGCVLSSIGLMSGEVPYTSFYARKSFIKNNKELIQRFTTALNNALEYTENNDSNTLANDIKAQFPDTSIDTLETIIQRYKDADSWWKNTYVSNESYNRLLDIMNYNDALSNEVDYNILVNNEFN